MGDVNAAKPSHPLTLSIESKPSDLECLNCLRGQPYDWKWKKQIIVVCFFVLCSRLLTPLVPGRSEEAEELSTENLHVVQDSATWRQAAAESGTLISVPHDDVDAVDVDALDFGLFTAKPNLKDLLKQSLPVVWPTLIAIWPQLLSQFLSLMWCTSIKEDGCVRQRLVPHPDVECFSDDHLPSALIAIIGLSAWRIGIPGVLFCNIYRLGRKRQELEGRRCYGLFIRGLDPWMWWWDLLVKRADIAIMMLVAYTSMVSDETAKIFVFAFISGMLLCLTTWCKPYSNNQGQILDILEATLLTARFVLYFTVALLLMILPSPTTARISATFVFVMIFCVVVFAVLHIVAQMLRREQQNFVKDEQEDVQDKEEK